MHVVLLAEFLKNLGQPSARCGQQTGTVLCYRISTLPSSLVYFQWLHVNVRHCVTHLARGKTLFAKISAILLLPIRIMSDVILRKSATATYGLDTQNIFCVNNNRSVNNNMVAKNNTRKFITIWSWYATDDLRKCFIKSFKSSFQTLISLNQHNRRQSASYRGIIQKSKV